MNRIQVVSELTIRNFDGAMGALTQAAEVIEDRLPRVLAWDIFVDEGHQRAVMYEEFNDEHALMEYETEMTGLGYRDELMKHAELDRFLILGAVSDPELLRRVKQAGATFMRHAVGAHR